MGGIVLGEKEGFEWLSLPRSRSSSGDGRDRSESCACDDRHA